MKETIKINLSGRLFDLDNDAYIKLKAYLDSLEKYFQGNSDETEEIIEGIESRIAELLAELLDERKEVITLADIESIINTMGTAQEMDAEYEQEETESKQSAANSSKAKKRFYRDPENSILGGVCGGLAAYFNIDPLWVRIAFVVATILYGGIIIYLILWIVIPKATTTSQKLEMRGEAVNINNIEKSVKEEFGKVKENIKNIPNSKPYKQTEDFFRSFFQGFGNVLLVILKILVIIVAIHIGIGLLTLIIGLISGFAFHFPFGNIIHDIVRLPFTFFGASWSLATLLILLVTIIPLIGLFMRLFRYVFNIKGHNRFWSSFGGTIWALSLTGLIIMYVSGNEDFSVQKKHTSRVELNVPQEKSIVIGIQESIYNDNELEHYQLLDHHYVYDNDEHRLMKLPILEIRESSDDKTYLEIIKAMHVFDPDYAEKKTDRRISYAWNMNDSTLLLNQYAMIQQNNGWRIPNVKIKLFIPEGKTVYLSPELEDYLSEKSKLHIDFEDDSNDMQSYTIVD